MSVSFQSKLWKLIVFWFGSYCPHFGLHPSYLEVSSMHNVTWCGLISHVKIVQCWSLFLCFVWVVCHFNLYRVTFYKQRAGDICSQRSRIMTSLRSWRTLCDILGMLFFPLSLLRNIMILINMRPLMAHFLHLPGDISRNSVMLDWYSLLLSIPFLEWEGAITTHDFHFHCERVSFSSLYLVSQGGKPKPRFTN